MDDNQLLSAIRERAAVPATRTDYAERGSPDLAAPATDDAIHSAETTIGHTFHPLHRRLLQEVSNGGFGPGDGLIGVQGGVRDAHGCSLIELRERLWLDSDAPLPAAVFPLCDWGDGIWSCIDAKTGVVLTLDENGLTDTGQSLRSWLIDWVSGVSLFENMYHFEARTGINPLTRQPTTVRLPVRPLGTPYRRG